MWVEWTPTITSRMDGPRDPATEMGTRHHVLGIVIHRMGLSRWQTNTNGQPQHVLIQQMLR